MHQLFLIYKYKSISVLSFFLLEREQYWGSLFVLLITRILSPSIRSFFFKQWNS